MKFIQESGVNVAHSVIVSGATNTEKDEEILDYLKQYGRIKTVIFVDDANSVFYKNLIVEYCDSSALTALNTVFPYTHQSKNHSALTFCVRSLAAECTATGGVRTPADYLGELKQLARRSGRDFPDILREMMGQISEHLEGIEQDSDLEGASVQIVEPASSLPGQQGSLSGHSTIPETATSNPSPDQQGSLPHPQRFSLSQTEMNPPEIQKVVVEHVVKTDTVPAFRLRPFSGKIPKPANETDYETWRSHIELLLADPNLAPLQITRRILESLLPPAADVVKGLGSNTIPSIYLKVLDSAFALVQDGEELFAQFLNTLQDPGEKPSAFLQRLQLTLNTVMKRGGILSSDFNKHLLKQFCRGCWDSDILNKLQLENLRSDPPYFAELLLLLRTEEGRQLAKENLMKKHLTASKPRAAVHSQSTCACSHSDTKAINELKQQMQKLQSQMAALLSQKSQFSKPAPPQLRSAQPRPCSSATSSRPRAGYCFKCGEDGHMSAGCANPPNPTLVLKKKKQLEKRQQAWDSNHKSSN